MTAVKAALSRCVVSDAAGVIQKSGGIMRSDNEIKRDVEDELRWDPDIDPTDIAVAVKSGVVTLTGFVRSYRRNLQPNVRPSAWRGSSASPMISKCAYPMRTRDPILKSRVMSLQTQNFGCPVAGSTSK